jgi:dephospho-CoA kinase
LKSLLFEANLHDCFDYLILISASKEKRLDRLEKKGEEKSKAEKRIMHQIPDINKRNLVDLVIENNNDIDALHKAADNFANHISEIKLKEVRPFIFSIICCQHLSNYPNDIWRSLHSYPL